MNRRREADIADDVIDEAAGTDYKPATHKVTTEVHDL